jgi:PelA/Pel-15E family pectate lyase
MRLLLFLLALHPLIVGTSRPAESLTPARVASLPKAEQKAWLDYLAASDRQRTADKAALAAERQGLAVVPPPPKESNSARSMPLARGAAYYASPEALTIAENILSFQLPNGGWPKNLDMAAGPRLKGQTWMPNNVSKYLGPDDFDQPAELEWNYAGTLDNDATNTELHFLARVQAAHAGHEGDKLRAAYLQGLAYLLHAQFPNGGWPQVWPLEGGYHDAITFNDNAVTESAETLHQSAEAQGDYAFVPASLRPVAGAAAERAIALVLRCQVVVAGRKTIWAQQHDALSLLPVAGRNFEPAALSAGESSDVLLFLMQLPHPGAAVRASVEAGVAWLKANAIYGQAWVGGRSPAQPRHLEAKAGAGPIWPRYTSIATGKPVFGDRDKSIHDNVDELTVERRNGYAWYSGGPKEALDAYAVWKAN